MDWPTSSLTLLLVVSLLVVIGHISQFVIRGSK